MRRIRAIVKLKRSIKVETDALQHRTFASLDSIIRFLDRIGADPCVKRLSSILNSYSFESSMNDFIKRFSSGTAAIKFQSSANASAKRYSSGNGLFRLNDYMGAGRGRTSDFNNLSKYKDSMGALRKAVSNITSGIRSTTSAAAIVMRTTSSAAYQRNICSMQGYTKRFLQIISAMRLQSTIDRITCTRIASASAQSRYASVIDANVARYALFSDYDALLLSGFDDQTLKALDLILD